MFPPVIAADAGTIVQGTITVLAILGGIVWLLDRRDAQEATKTLEDRVRAEGTVASRLGDLILYVEPPKLAATGSQVDEFRVWPITAGVRASVEAAGSISVTRGRNLAAKAVGGAIVPGGVFLFGNARDTAHDNRELFLIVEGPNWAHTHAVDPTDGVAARQFMQAINLAAQKLEPLPLVAGPAEPVRAPTGGDTIERLERLTRLKDSGALTPDEFEAQKRAVLHPD